MAAGQAENPAVARGIAYLSTTQKADGGWDEEPYTAVGFPRVFYLRYASAQDTTLTIGGRSWLVYCGYGHSNEHASLFCPALDIVISGDMLLPRISTNVSVYDADPDADPLGLYLSSLDRYLPLPDDTLVLPSHGKPFTGMKPRIDQLKAHHDERLAETLGACEKPATAREIVPVLFRRELDIHQMTFAMGEAIAHLNYLLRRGKLSRQLCDDGVLRFCVV